MRPREQPRITESYRGFNPGDDLLSERAQLGLRLLQPIRHTHLAIHRRRGGEVLLRRLALACAPEDLARGGGSGSPLFVVSAPLPRAPGRRRESWLARRDFVGPDDHLPAVLPLGGHRLLRDLESALVDREVAKDGLRLQL